MFLAHVRSSCALGNTCSGSLSISLELLSGLSGIPEDTQSRCLLSPAIDIVHRVDRSRPYVLLGPHSNYIGMMSCYFGVLRTTTDLTTAALGKHLVTFDKLLRLRPQNRVFIQTYMCHIVLSARLQRPPRGPPSVMHRKLHVLGWTIRQIT